MPLVQEIWAPLPLHPCCRCATRGTCLSHPPALRPGSADEGRRVGIPPERQQWRPTSFGSERCSDNGATIAASKRSQAPLGLYNRPSAATAFPRGLTQLLPMRPGRLSVISGNAPPAPFDAKAPWLQVRHSRDLPLPPALRPGRPFWGWVGGAVSREQQRRPTCFGRERSRRALYLQHALA